jgi:hypothetical protein
MNKLNVIKQQSDERLRQFGTRIKERRAKTIYSQRKTIGGEALAGLDQTNMSANLTSIDAVVLKNFIRGLFLALHDIMA